MSRVGDADNLHFGEPLRGVLVLAVPIDSRFVYLPSLGSVIEPHQQGVWNGRVFLLNAEGIGVSSGEMLAIRLLACVYNDRALAVLIMRRGPCHTANIPKHLICAFVVVIDVVEFISIRYTEVMKRL